MNPFLHASLSIAQGPAAPLPSSTISAAVASLADKLREITSSYPNKHVCISTHSQLNSVISILACFQSDHCAIPLPSSQNQSKSLEYYFQDSLSPILITDYQVDFKSCPANIIYFSDYQSFIHSKNMDTPFPISDVPSLPDSSLMVYTSGTSGSPKGVVHSISSLKAQCQNLSPWKLHSSERLLNCLPLYHVHGLINGVLYPLFQGATIEFAGSFSLSQTLERFSSKSSISPRIDVLFGVPTIYNRLVNAFESRDSLSHGFQNTRLFVSGSDALSTITAQKWSKFTQSPILERYGMTETGMVLSNPLNPDLRKIGTVGVPLPLSTCRVVDEVLYVSSPTLMDGYWNSQDGSLNKPFELDSHNNRWFETGDVVSVDQDGYYTIMGRASIDIVKRGGHKINTRFIEKRLALKLSTLGIQELVCFGVPDSDLGQKIVLQLIIDPSLTKDFRLENIQKAVFHSLPPDHSPDSFVFSSQPIPKSGPMKKINKKLLSSIALDHGWQESTIHVHQLE